jgi:hypothetical protein
VTSAMFQDSSFYIDNGIACFKKKPHLWKDILSDTN